MIDKYAKDSKFKTSKKLLKLAKIKLRQYSPKENGK